MLKLIQQLPSDWNGAPQNKEQLNALLQQPTSFSMGPSSAAAADSTTTDLAAPATDAATCSTTHLSPALTLSSSWWPAGRWHTKPAETKSARTRRSRSRRRCLWKTLRQEVDKPQLPVSTHIHVLKNTKAYGTNWWGSSRNKSLWPQRARCNCYFCVTAAHHHSLAVQLCRLPEWYHADHRSCRCGNVCIAHVMKTVKTFRENSHCNGIEHNIKWTFNYNTNQH